LTKYGLWDTGQVRIWRSSGQGQGHGSKRSQWPTSIGNFHRYSPDGATEQTTRRGWSGLRL